MEKSDTYRRKMQDTRLIDSIIGLGSLMIIVMAVVVMFGWVINEPMLVQIFPDLAPMQFNTALCFLLIGMGVAVLTMRLFIVARVLGAVTILLAALTVLQYVIGINFGIDQLFMTHHITVETSHPGRMAPNTGFCFVLAGILLLIIKPQNKHASVLVSILFSFIVLVLGLVSLGGYITDLATMARWGAMTNMAVHTSIGFVVWGIISLVVIMKYNNPQTFYSQYFVPIISFCISLSFFIMLWQVILYHEVSQMKKTLQAISQEVKQEYASNIGSQFDAMIRLKDRLLSPGRTNYQLWRHDVMNYFQDHKSIDMIGWVSDDGRLQQYEVRPDARMSINKGVMNMPVIQKAIDAASNQNNLNISRPFPINNVRYFAVFFPFKDSQVLKGYKVAIYNLTKLTDLVRGQILFKDYNLEIKNDGKIIYNSNAHNDPSLKTRWSFNSELNEFGERWQIKVWPTWSMLQSFQSQGTLIILIFGIMFSSLLAYLIKVRRDMLDKQRELIESNKNLDVFAHSISHDLRAPLRHMVGFVDLLKQEARGKFNSEIDDYIETIESSAQQMEDLISGMTTLSKSQSQPLTHMKIALEPLVRDVISELSDEIDGRSIQWEFKKLRDVYADKELFKSAITNLLSNAIKFTRQVDSPHITIFSKIRRNQVIIGIKDNGVGFRSSYADKLFDLFKRVHKESEYEGLGIGLANVEKIIRRHGGRVWAEGEINQGATFYISLPKDAEQ